MNSIKYIKLPNGTVVPIADSRIPDIAGNSNKVLKTNSDGTAFEYADPAASTPFIVNLTYLEQSENDDGSLLLSADQSYADTVAAFNSGRDVYLFLSDGVSLQVTSFVPDMIIAYTILFSLIAVTGQVEDGQDVWRAFNIPFISNVRTNEYFSDSGSVANGHNVATEIKLNGTDYFPDVVYDDEGDPTGRAVISLSAVTKIRVNGSDYSPDAGGTVNLGSIDGGSGGGAATLDVSDDNNGNIGLALLNTSSVLNISDDNNGNIGISLS